MPAWKTCVYFREARLPSNLVGLYTALNRPADAKAKYQEAIAHKVNNPLLHGNRYGVAFYEGDVAEMERQVGGQKNKPGEDVLLSFASDTDAFYGRLASAREKTQRAVEAARRGDATETAAGWQMNSALREAEFGNTIRARQEIACRAGHCRDSGCTDSCGFSLGANRRCYTSAATCRRFGSSLSPEYHYQSLLAADYRCLNRDRPQ